MCSVPRPDSPEELTLPPMEMSQFSTLPETYVDPDANLPEAAPIPPFPIPITSSLPEALGAARLGDREALVSKAGRPAGVALLGLTEGKSSRMCGLKRRTLLISVAVALAIIVAATVGGVVGGTRAKGHGSSSSPDTETPSTPSTTPVPNSSTILPNSALASANWTDPEGYQHYYVFHQDRNEAIVQSSYDSQNKTWKARSIWDTASLSPKLQTATPLAAIAWHDDDSDWNIKLFVLYSDLSMRVLFVDDYDPDSGWKAASQVDTPGTRVGVGNGSNLSAWCQPRGDVTAILVYQDDQDYIVCANDSYWNDPLIIQPSARKGSGIAVTSLDNDDSPGSPAFRVYYHNSDTLLEARIGDNFSDYDIRWGDRPLAVLDNSVTPNFAAVTFSLTDSMVVNIDAKGRPMARWWDADASWLGYEEPTFKNSPEDVQDSSKFTAIAMNADLRVYGIVDGIIHEWRFEAHDPMTWMYVGRVVA